MSTAYENIALVLLVTVTVGCAPQSTTRPGSQPASQLAGRDNPAYPTEAQSAVLQQIEDLGGFAHHGTSNALVELDDRQGEPLTSFVVDTKSTSETVRFSVYLQGKHIKDEHLALVESLGNVEQLSLSDSSITDAGLEMVGKLPTIRLLYLSNTSVTDAGLSKLSGLTNLEMISLGDTSVTDEGLIHLQSLKTLKGLSLSKLRITDAGVRELLVHKQLQGLSLSGTLVTDGAVDDLSKLVALQGLDLHSTSISESGIKRLRATLPNCKIGR